MARGDRAVWQAKYADNMTGTELHICQAPPAFCHPACRAVLRRKCVMTSVHGKASTAHRKASQHLCHAGEACTWRHLQALRL